jgi:gliding motility-associated protein GldL
MKKSFFESKGAKRFLAMAYGIGAAIVIAGAMFKILHWPFANQMLTLGMSTEVLIFFISAFEPPHQDIDWSLVYPELAGEESTQHKKNTGSVSAQLDKMLIDAKVTPDMIGSLGTGLKSLSENVNSMSNLANAATSTNHYTESVQKAAKSVEGLSSSYVKATEAMNTLTASSEGSKQYAEQVTKVTKNLSALNALYEVELQNTDSHIKNMSTFYSKLGNVLGNLSNAEASSAGVKEEIGKLAKNLTNLNNVYGNMLNAMTGSKANG